MQGDYGKGRHLDLLSACGTLFMVYVILRLIPHDMPIWEVRYLP